MAWLAANGSRLSLASAACYKLPDVVRAALVEFLLMTLFVFFGCGSALSILSFNQMTLTNDVPVLVMGLLSPAATLAIAFVFGMTIMVLISGFGHLSGGHINPAVTLSLWFAGACDWKRLILYWVGQFTGSILGASIVWGCFTGVSQQIGDTGTNVASGSSSFGAYPSAGTPPLALGSNSLSPRISVGSGFLLEMMGTFFLCLTVLMTVKHSGNLSEGKLALAPLPIGYAVFIAHVVLVPFTGCGINPGRSFGPSVVDALAGNPSWTSTYWIYFIGPFTGAFIAANVFWILRDVSDEAKLTHPYHGLFVLNTGDALDAVSNTGKTVLSTAKGFASRVKDGGKLGGLSLMTLGRGEGAGAKPVESTPDQELETATAVSQV